MERDSIGRRLTRGRLERAANNGLDRLHNDHCTTTNGGVKNGRFATFTERYVTTSDICFSSTQSNGSFLPNGHCSKHRKNPTGIKSTSTNTRDNDVNLETNTIWSEMAADLGCVLILTSCCIIRLHTEPTAASITWQEKPIVEDTMFYVQKQFFVPRHQPPGLPIILYLLANEPSESEILDLSGKIARLSFCAMIPVLFVLNRLLGIKRIISLLVVAALLNDDALILTAVFELINSVSSLLLLLCIMCSVLQQSSSFLSVSWLLSTVMYGLTVALASCVSYRSLWFTAPLIFGSLFRSWALLSDKTWQLANIGCKLATEITTLIILPAFMYLAMFHIHFQLAHRSSAQASQMTSSFQLSLSDGLSSFSSSQSLHVLFGSRVTVRSFGKACWLNSNHLLYPLNYPDGRGSSYQQVVGCYSYKDLNNWWTIESNSATKVAGYVSYGDVIQLRHGSTGRLLNSHNVSAALTPEAQEVSCYLDHNNAMQPEILWKLTNPTALDSTAPIRSFKDPFHLVHGDTNAHLRLSRKRLPDWGGGKLELVADRRSHNDQTDWFNFEESNTSPNIADTNKKEEDATESNIEQVTPTFHQKFSEIHGKVWKSPNRLVGFMESAHTVSFAQWTTYRNLTVGYFWTENETYQSIVAKSSDTVRFFAHISTPALCIFLVVGSVMRQRGIEFDEKNWTFAAKFTGQILPLYMMQLIAVCVFNTKEFLFLYDYDLALLTSLMMSGAAIQCLFNLYLWAIT